MKNLGILLSGRGSNFVAIADSIAAGAIPNARIAVVISNRPTPPGSKPPPARPQRNRHSSKGKPRAEHDREVVAALLDNKVDLVCLAGYMRLLSPWFVQQFRARILNIHPSLLHPSLAWKRSNKHSPMARSVGMHGAFCGRRTRPRRHHRAENGTSADSDDEPTLAARILQQEHIAYTEAINIVLEGKFNLVGRRVVKGQRSEVRLQK